MNVVPFPRRRDLSSSIPLDRRLGSVVRPGSAGADAAARFETVLVQYANGVLHCREDAAHALIQTGLFTRRLSGGVDIVDAEVAERLSALAQLQGEGTPARAMIGFGKMVMIAETFADPSGEAQGFIVLRRLLPAPWSVPTLIEAYGLTPREADVALALMLGLTIHAIAERFELRTTTVRQYLKAIYLKTDTSSQAQLVAALNGSDVDGEGMCWSFADALEPV